MGAKKRCIVVPSRYIGNISESQPAFPDQKENTHMGNPFMSPGPIGFFMTTCASTR